MQTTFRRLAVTWPLVIFFLLPALARAETAVQAWVQRYHGPVTANYFNFATALAVDSSNNVVVMGTSTGSETNLEYATIKYSSAGVPLWTNLYDGPTQHWGTAWGALAVDRNNDVIMTGTSIGSRGRWDFMTVKCSGAGVPLWTNRYNGPGGNNDVSEAVVVDGNKDVIVTGYWWDINGFHSHYATIKYSSSGVPLWTNLFIGREDSNDLPFAAAVDGNNDIVVTGVSRGSEGYDKIATIKYSSAGVPLWTNRYNGPVNSLFSAPAVAVDGDNNVIVRGGPWTSEGYDHIVTIKYSSAGVPLWANLFNGPVSSLFPAPTVAVDGNNDVIVVGGCGTSESNYDYATIKYSSAGMPLWTNCYNGPRSLNDIAIAVAVDGSNSVIVVGYSPSSTGLYDYTAIKYSSAGVPFWTNRYDGPANNEDVAYALAVDHSGNVIMTGGSDVNASGEREFATIKYICVPEPVVTGLPPTNGTFPMRVDAVLQPGTLVIEASTDLEGWAPVFTNTTSTNVLFYADPDAGTGSSRFYRAFQFP